MIQTNVKIETAQAEFLKHYSEYGFQDENELVREALNRLKDDLEQKSLTESAVIGEPSQRGRVLSADVKNRRGEFGQAQIFQARREVRVCRHHI